MIAGVVGCPGIAHQVVTEVALQAHEPLDARLELVELVGWRRRPGPEMISGVRGLVDQDAVNLVDDGVVVAALDELVGIDGHAVVA